MTCFESHVPGARHRDAGAISQTAPSRILVKSAQPGTVTSSSKSATPQEVLVIASRLKEYIQAKGDMNTSASVMDVLSSQLRILCDRAMDNARADGRKTVMDRDFDFLKES